MGMMAKEELGLEGLFTPLGTYPSRVEVLMGVACVTLSFSLRNGIYVGNIEWYIMSKSPT